MKKVLVTGGAGYIGSVTVKQLCDAGYTVVVVDNLDKGSRTLVDKRATLVVVDICNQAALTRKLTGQTFDVIMHFAARKDAGESMTMPELYHDNLVGTMNMISLAPLLKVKQFIFSSSAAVYGMPVGQELVDEASPCTPTNFYGYTKLVGEQLLAWMHQLHKINYVSLRYFNVAGDGGLRYIDPNAKNIFNVIADVLTGTKKRLDIFGDDYDTVDGTGVRDYIHVSDIASAHVRALTLRGAHTINIGSGRGYSVREIVNAFEQVSGLKVPAKVVKRRQGDVATLCADATLAATLLRFKPTYGLREMVESTWAAYSVPNR